MMQAQLMHAALSQCVGEAPDASAADISLQCKWMQLAQAPSCADAAQEPVEPLKTEYKQAINALETSLGHEDTQKVG